MYMYIKKEKFNERKRYGRENTCKTREEEKRKEREREREREREVYSILTLYNQISRNSLMRSNVISNIINRNTGIRQLLSL